MRLPRVSSAHGSLTVIELFVAPVAILTTFLVLYLTAGLVAATRNVGSLLGVGATGIELVNWLLVLMTVLALLSAGGLAVFGYRFVINRWFEDRSLAPFVLVPLIGIVVPFAYTITTTTSTALSWWPFVIVALSAHALAFRAIAVHSLCYGLRRYDVLVATFTAIPAVVALTVFVTETLLVEPGDEIAQLLVAAITGPGIALDRSVLVAAPLLTSVFYVIRWITTEDWSWTNSDWPTTWAVPVVASSPWSIPDWSPVNRFENDGRLRSWLTIDWSPPSLLAFDWSRPDVFERVHDRAVGGTSRKRAATPRSSSAAGWRGPPPVSSSLSKRSQKVGRSASGSHGASNASANGPSDAGPSASNGSAVVRVTEKSRRSDDGRVDGSEVETSPMGRNEVTERRVESSADRSSSTKQSSTDAPSSSARRSGNGSSGEGTGSDTRIFVDDFGRYTGDSSPVESCPGCDEVVPSKSDSLFCPSCGNEL